MTQAWTVVWAQWRSYCNYATQSSVLGAVIVGVIWYGLWSAGAVLAAFLMMRVKVGMVGTVSGALLAMSLYWQLMPIMLAATGMSLDLGKLKCHPIPVRDLFTIEVLLHGTAAMELLIVPTGAAIGVLLNPNLPGWGITERFYRWPSATLGDPLGVLVEKETRYLARSSRFRMVFLMSCVFGLFLSRGIFRTTASWWAPNYLVLEAAYALPGLCDICIWNLFGFDRSAAQIYFLAPVEFSQVLVAKNLTAAIWVTFQFLTALLICTALRFPVNLDRVAEAAATTTVMALFQIAVGNYMAVANPRAIDPDSSWRSRSPGGAQFLTLLVFPLTILPVALAYLARWALQSNAAFFGMLGLLGAIAFVVYRVALDSTVQYAEQRKEQMITALTAEQSPISS